MFAILLISLTATSAWAQPDHAARAKEAADLLAAGKAAAAAKIYQELVTALPGDAGLKMNLGMALHHAGRPGAALKPLLEATRADASLMPAWLFLGATHLALGDAPSAVPAIARVVDATPDNPWARQLLGDAYMQTGRHVDALLQYLRLTRLEPSNATGWFSLGRSAEAHAEEIFDRLQAMPNSRAAIELIGADVLLANGTDNAALEATQSAVAADPGWRTAQEALAELLERKGQTAEAATVKARAAALTQDCASEPAACAYRDNKIGQVLQLTGFPAAQENPKALFWRLKALNVVASDAFARLEALPASVQKHAAIGDLRLSQRRYPEAAEAFRAALALAPSNTAIKVDLAFALQSQRAHDEVVQLLAPAAADKALSPRGLFVYGDALLALQRLDEAIPALTASVEQAPDQPVARGSLGRALVLAAKYAEAIPHLEAAKGTDVDGAIYYQLAQAYQRVGRADDAKAALLEYRQRAAR